MKQNPSKMAYLKKALTVILFGLLVFYFTKEFSKNFDAIKHAKIELKALPLFAAFATTIAAYLVLTLAWRDSFRDLTQKSLTIFDSIAILNIPALGKYIPGKVWSYTFQMYWLNKHGFAKTAVLYNNLLNVAMSLGVAMWLGCLYFLIQKDAMLSLPQVVLGYFLLLCANVIFIWQEHRILSVTIDFLNKFLNNKIVIFKTAKMTLIKLQFYYMLIYLLFGVSLWLIVWGIGLSHDIFLIYIFIVSYALGDAIGFLSLLSPGGLGVREGVMYNVLKTAFTSEFALILPIISRVTCMLSEALIAGVSLIYLKFFGLRGYYDIDADTLNSKNLR